MARQIVFLPEFINYLDELSFILYESEYFGFKDSAKKYTDKIFNFCQLHVGVSVGKKAPAYFNHYGINMKYITYKPNKQTSWYIFYQQYKNKYIVRYITNNHVSARYFPGE
jgi:hypothetical protein